MCHKTIPIYLNRADLCYKGIYLANIEKNTTKGILKNQKIREIHGFLYLVVKRLIFWAH